MARKSGLGKGFGINALIPEVKEEKIEKADLMLDINLIVPNKEQPRKTFDKEKIQALADSISQHGIVQPLVVVKEKDYYKIVAGERRFRAAKELKLKEVPVIVKEYTDLQISEIALVENLQREDLNPVEEAMGLKQLMEKFSLTQEEAAKKVGKSRSAVANTLRLLELPKEVSELLVEGKLSMGHARALLGVKESKNAVKLAEIIIKNDLNVRQTEALVRKENESVPKEIKEEPATDRNVENAVTEQTRKLESKYGVKIKVKYTKAFKGKIEMSFADYKQMNALFELLDK